MPWIDTSGLRRVSMDPSRGGRRSAKFERHARLYAVLFRLLNDGRGHVGHVPHGVQRLKVGLRRLLLLVRPRTVEGLVQQVDHAAILVIEKLHLPSDGWKGVIVLDLGVGIELMHAGRIKR